MSTQNQTHQKPKILMIGVDQAIYRLILKFMDEGLLPAIKSLIERGTMTEAFSCPPCDTPTNWTTIATGATTGVHGSTSFYPHAVGESFEIALKQRSRSMLSTFCQAEYIWDAADRAGLKSFVINYPAGWPGTLKNGVISTFTWNVPEVAKRIIKRSNVVSFKAEHKKESRKIKSLSVNEIPAEIASNLSEEDKNSRIMQINLELSSKNPPTIAYIGKSAGKNVLWTRESAEQQYQGFQVEEWTNFHETKMNSGEKTVKGLYKVHLVENPSPEEIKIQYSPLYSIDSWVNPPEYAEGLIRNALGSLVSYSSDVEYMIEGEIEDFLGEAHYECEGIVKALDYMKQEMDWDLAIFHIHFLDSVNHYSLAYLEDDFPLVKENPDYVETARSNIRTAYKIIDDMVQELLNRVVDENTTVFFVADHGAIPVWKTLNLTPALANAGFTHYDLNEKNYNIDWTKSKIFPYYEPHYIWVNLIGRDPQGIIHPGEEYEQVRNEVIKFLENLEDPETKEKIMRVVYRREEAAHLGQNGERVGDIVYFLNPPYQIFDGDINQLKTHEFPQYLWDEPLVQRSKVCYGAHAYYLPTVSVGECSVSVPLIIAGPNIKQGVKLNPPVNLIDVTPTMARILGIDPPRSAQGRVLREIFKNKSTFK